MEAAELLAKWAAVDVAMAGEAQLDLRQAAGQQGCAACVLVQTDQA